MTMSPGSYQHFTIFVVELLEGNKAMYKPCAKFEGRFQVQKSPSIPYVVKFPFGACLCPRVAFQDQKALFDCNENEGHSGQFVYLRDDREDKEYFGLCEVEVFVHKGESREARSRQPHRSPSFCCCPATTAPIGAG